MLIQEKIDLQIIDVTLRDGGYFNNFQFPEKVIFEVVRNLDKANIPFIEVGYLGGSPFKINNPGITHNITPEFLIKLKNNVTKTKLGIIAHPKMIHPNDIIDLYQNGTLGLVRICVSPDNIKEASKLIEQIRKLDILISVNFVRMSQLNISDIMPAMLQLEKAGADIIYIADSIGALNPTDVKNIISNIEKNLNAKIGFHAHDNLGIAFINSITAIKSGARFIDASLRGIGKGGGNLSLEQFCNFISENQLNTVSKYNMNNIIKVAYLIGTEIMEEDIYGKLFQIYIAQKNYSYEMISKVKDFCLQKNISWIDYDQCLE